MHPSLSAPRPALPFTALCAAAVLLALSEAAANMVDEASNKRQANDEASDPVLVTSGEYVFDLPLFGTGGPMPLTLGLSYLPRRMSRPDYWYDLGRGIDHNLPRLRNVFGSFVDRGVGVENVNGTDEIDFTLTVSNTWQLAANTSPVYELLETGTSSNNGCFYFLHPGEERVYVFAKTNTVPGVPLAWILDRHGNRWTFGSDTNGRVTTAGDGLGRSLRFDYADEGITGLTNIADWAGRQCAFSYFGVLLDTAVLPGGATNRFAWGRAWNPTTSWWWNALSAWQRPAGNTPYTVTNAVLGAPYLEIHTLAQTDAYGNRTRFFYSTNATTVVWADGSTNLHGRTLGPSVMLPDLAPVTNFTDAAGQSVRLRHDGAERMTGLTDRLGGAMSFGWEPASGKPEALTNALGLVTRATYVAAPQAFTNPASGETVAFTFRDLVRVDLPDGTFETYVRDARGNLLGRTDGAGGTWRYAYNGFGQPVAATNPAGGAISLAYGPTALLLRAADSDGGSASFGYDAAFRVSAATNADGTVRRFAYDASDRLTNFVDEAGQSWSWQYDANGNLLRAVEPDGFARRWMYDAMDRVTNEADTVGALASFAYDNRERLASATDATGMTTFRLHDPRGWVTNVVRGGSARAFAYDAEGLIESATSPEGRVTQYRRNALGMITGVVDAAGGTWDVARDAMSRVVRVTDPLGHAVSNVYEGRGLLAARVRPDAGAETLTYDAAGRLARHADYAGGVWDYAYSPLGRLVAATNPAGGVHRVEYDSRGRVTREIGPDGAVVSNTYDALGRVVRLLDPVTNAWLAAYNHRGQTTAATNPSGGTIVFTYNPDGTLFSSRDSDTAPATNQYDAARRLVRTTLANGTGVALEYENTNGQVSAVADAAARTWRFAYDRDGNLLAATDPAGGRRTAGYDALNRPVSVTDRTDRATALAYDAAGRLVRVTHPSGLVVSNGYDAAGRRTSVAVGGGQWTFTYDGMDRIRSSTTPLGRTVALGRDALGRVTNIVDGLGRETRFVLDAAGRVTGVTDPLGRTRAYGYDAAGRLTSASEPGAGTARYAYDAAGRLSRIADLNTQDWTFGWTPAGRLVLATDPLGRTQRWSYDAAGRLAAVTNADGSFVRLRYDAAGRETNRSYSTGLELVRAYDAAGRLVSAGDVALGRDAEGRVTNVVEVGVAFGAAYNADGRLQAVTYSNGAFTVTYAYDAASGLLESVQDSLGVARVDFVYDRDRRLCELRRANGVNATLTHDGAGRLIRIRDGSVLDLQYALDAAGEVAGLAATAPLDLVSALATSSASNRYDAACQISLPGYAYDAMGRLTNSPARAYRWDAASRLVQAGAATMTYNGLDEPATRAEGGQTRRFLRHPAIASAPIVAERDEATGRILRYYVWTPGGALLYLVDVAAGGQVRYYHFDRAGSTLALTDAAGAVTDAYAYTPFGVLVARTGSSPQPFTFVGRLGVRQEGADGLYDMRNRFYDARTGRFLSPDPLWPRIHRPLELDPYQYCRNRPLSVIDPLGLDGGGADAYGADDDVWCEQCEWNEGFEFGLALWGAGAGSEAAQDAIDGFIEAYEAGELEMQHGLRARVRHLCDLMAHYMELRRGGRPLPWGHDRRMLWDLASLEGNAAGRPEPVETPSAVLADMQALWRDIGHRRKVLNRMIADAREEQRIRRFREAVSGLSGSWAKYPPQDRVETPGAGVVPAAPQVAGQKSREKQDRLFLQNLWRLTGSWGAYPAGVPAASPPEWPGILPFAPRNMPMVNTPDVAGQRESQRKRPPRVLDGAGQGFDNPAPQTDGTDGRLRQQDMPPSGSTQRIDLFDGNGLPPLDPNHQLTLEEMEAMRRNDLPPASLAPPAPGGPNRMPPGAGPAFPRAPAAAPLRLDVGFLLPRDALRSSPLPQPATEFVIRVRY